MSSDAKKRFDLIRKETMNSSISDVLSGIEFLDDNYKKFFILGYNALAMDILKGKQDHMFKPLINSDENKN